MESKRVISGFILTLALASCQSAAQNSPPTSSQKSLKTTYNTQTIRQGTFQNAERPTSGTVEIAKAGENYHVLLRDDFKTSKGPELQIILHRSSNLLPELSPPTFPLESSDYVVVGPLKSLKGEQSYSIPSNINIQDHRSVAIWCKKFNATFGAASLQSGK